MTPEEAIAKMRDLATPKADSNKAEPQILGSMPKLNLDYDLNSSVKRLEELRADRNLTDIPLDDEYWSASRKHQFAFGRTK